MIGLRNLYELRPSNKPVVRVRGSKLADVLSDLPRQEHVLIYIDSDGLFVGEVRCRLSGRSTVLVKVVASAETLARWLCERTGPTGQRAVIQAGLKVPLQAEKE